MTPKRGRHVQMTPSYRNLNAINLIEYFLYDTQSLARSAGEINGESEYSLACRSTAS